MSGKLWLCGVWQQYSLGRKKSIWLLMLRTVSYCLPEDCKGWAAGGMHRGGACKVIPAERFATLVGEVEGLALWLQGTPASIVCTQGATATLGRMPAGRAEHCTTW